MGDNRPTLAHAAQWWQRPALLIGLVVLFAVPLAIVAHPPLIDLPAHMARYHIAANLHDSARLARYFSFSWRFIPNLGVDLPIIALAPLVGTELATRIIVTLIPALAAGGMLLIGTADRRRIPAASLVALPLAFAYPMVFGFVNACLAVALAMIAFGLWLRLCDRGWVVRSMSLAGLAAPVILTAHIVGYGVFGVAIFGASVGRAIEQRHPWPSAIRDTIFACLPVIWPFLLLSLWSTGSAPSANGWFDWQSRLTWIVGILRDHWAPLDIASALFLYIVMLLPILRPARFAYAPRLAVPGVILWMLALGLPTTLITQFASVRLISIAAAFTILAIRPRSDDSSAVAVAAVGFILLRLSSVIVSSLDAGRDYARELTALDHIARGSRVIALRAVDCERHWRPDRLAHIASFATMRRDAFVNDQFVTNEAQLLAVRDDQPVLRRWTDAIVLKTPCGRWTNRPTLTSALTTLPWGDMDYLWLIDAPADLRPSDPRLRPLWQAGQSILYRAEPSKGPAR